MNFRCFAAVLVLITTPATIAEGQGLTEVLAKLFDEKITHPETRQLMMEKLPELQVCLKNMAAMTPEITMQVLDGMIPALNTCGIKTFSAPVDKRPSVFIDCCEEAAANVKASSGMGADDAKLFAEGMECLEKAMAF
ncbi:uncharacterized protein LOC144172437 [Haemaphysalis longicornis]